MIVYLMGNTAKDPLVGTRIREYEILDIIGKGGMGAVYRARHEYLDEERAIKVINAPATGDDSPFINRFIREAKILTKLRHPNLVELYEFGRLDGQMFFMVMELIQGESVRQRMKTLGRIPLRAALRIIREAALGLSLAHQKGIVHRDISPDNLMLVKNEGGEEVTKVIDFGIAKPTHKETSQFTIGNMFIGKPEFSSPEQCGFHEEGEEIDQRADVYSLAVTLYYILSGKLPFYSATPQGYLVKHASETPKPLSTHFAEGELPEKVNQLVSKALSKKRDDRHSSMIEFVQDIDAIFIPPSGAFTVTPSKMMSLDFPTGFLFAKRYEIDRKLGRGGMGVVYKALDKFLDIPVALKTMNPNIADDDRTLSRLKREVILARKVAHPNVCRIYDIGESDGIHYISMELLEGRALSEILLKDGALSIQSGLQIMRQVLDAMDAAHSAGIFHRDMKPQNIMVDSNGRTHIMDFGISTSAEVSKLTQTGALIGTPRYMAPEQFGGGTNVDQRADVYSIGIIMFEMFTGMLPFEANTPASVMFAHLHTAPVRPSQLISSFPAELENVILKALEKDPENRYQSVAQFKAALEPLLKKSVTLAAPISATSASTMVFPQERRAEEAPSTPAVEPATVLVPSAKDINFPPEAATEPDSRKVVEQGGLNKNLIFAGAGALIVVIGLVIWFFSGSKKPEESVSQSAQTTQAANPPGTSTTTPPVTQPSTGAVIEKPEVKQPEPVTEQQPTQPEPAPQPEAGKGSSAEIPPVSTTTPAANPETPTETPAKSAAQPGTLSYQGPYHVTVYHEKKLVMDSQSSSSVQLPAGSYTFTVLGKEKVVIRDVQKLEIKPGETASIQIPAMGSISVSANPSNCKVFINGNFVDNPPIFNLPIQVGTHQIRVVWEKQNKESSSDITVSAGESKRIRAVISGDSADVFPDSN